jgi:hypothetical protein
MSTRITEKGTVKFRDRFGSRIIAIGVARIKVRLALVLCLAVGWDYG